MHLVDASRGVADVNLTRSHLRDCLWSFKLDPPRTNLPILDSNRQLQPGFIPWFLLSSANVLELGRSHVHLIALSPRTILNKPDLLYGVQCLIAQAYFGTTLEEINRALRADDASQRRLAADTKQKFATAGKQLPALRAAELVLLTGGESAFFHVNGIIATMCGSRLVRALRMDQDDLRNVLLLISSAAYCYDLSADGTFVRLIDVAAYILCKAPRPECGHGMPEDYIDRAFVLDGDWGAGCTLSVVMRDAFQRLLQYRSERDEVNDAADLFGYSHNNYNPKTKAEIGIDAPGTHYVHPWYRDLRRSVRESENAVVIAHDLLDFSVAGCPDGKDVATFFGFSVPGALDYFEPVALWKAASLPAEKSRHKGFSDGKDWALGKARFFFAPLSFVQMDASLADDASDPALTPRRMQAPDLATVELTSARADIPDVRRFHQLLCCLQQRWSSVPVDQHPVTHVIVDGLADWLEDRPFIFDENPGFRGAISMVVLFVRANRSIIFTLCALLVYKNSKSSTFGAFLVALYTHQDHTRKGYATEALAAATRYLKQRQYPASLPNHKCINAVMSNAWYEKQYTSNKWVVGKISRSKRDNIAVTFDPQTAIIDERETALHATALWSAYIALPVLATGVCVTIDGYAKANAQGSRVRSYKRVGHVFAIPLVRRLGSCTCMDLAMARVEQGGTRDSMFRALRAPEIDDLDWKQSASKQLRLAEAYLSRGGDVGTRSSAVPMNLHGSVQYPQWHEAIDFVAENWTASGVLETLIPNLYEIDVNHRWYEHFKYPAEHPLKR